MNENSYKSSLFNDDSSFKKYFDLLPNLVSICDENSHIIYANPAFIKFSNTPINQLYKSNIFDIISDEHKTHLKSNVEKAIFNKKNYTFESHPTINNQSYDLEWQAIYDNTQNTILYTSHHIAAKHIEQNKASIINSAFDLATDPIIIAKNIGTCDNPIPSITYVNQAFVKLTNYNLDEIEGKNPIFIYEQINNPNKVELIAEAFRNWEAFNIEILSKTKNGSNKWLSVSIAPIKDKHDIFTHWISIQKDITIRVQQEEQLRIFHSAVKYSRDAILITEASPIDLEKNGPKIIYANDYFTTLTGFSKQEVIDNTPRILQGEETSKIATQNIRKALQEWTPIQQDVLNYKKNGEKFWIDLSIFPVADDSGFFTHWVSFQRDITERIEMQNELEKTVAERTIALKNANRKLQAFASVASHDLKAPLRMIHGYLEILKKELYKNKQFNVTVLQKEVEIINAAQKGATDASKLIEGILEYSTMERGAYNWTMVDLEKKIESILFLLKRNIDKVKAQVLYDNLPHLNGNKIQLKQLFQNIITNALKFRNPDSCIIKINCEQTDTGYLFSISDNGVGMRKEDKDSIFEVFKRARTEKRYEGQGLGLSICKEVLENHNGKIWVESELGIGSTFYFTINTN